MSLNFSQLKTEVENRTGSHNRTGEFVNTGQLELAREAQNIEKQNIVFVSGVASVPSTCLAIIEVLWEKIPIEKMDVDMYIYDDTSNPTEYIIKNGQIVLNTKISSTQTNGLAYIPRPATMTNDLDAPLADSDNALIAYARYMVYTDLEQADKANFWLDRWELEKDKWLKLNKKQNPRYRRTKIHGYY